MAHYKGAASEAGRAMHLMKKREKALEEIELRKKKIEEDLKLSNIENKFAAHYDAVEQQLKSSTIGLVTLDEMKAKQENIVKERERKLAQKQEEKEREKLRALEAKQAEKNRQKRQIQALSFNLEEDEAEDEEGDEDDDKDTETGTSDTINIKTEPMDVQIKEEPIDEDYQDLQERIKAIENENVEKMMAKKRSKGDNNPALKKKIRKNPDVDTSFLPDREREEEENRLREELRQEWAAKQSTLKEEEIEVTFSYWDGSGHRKTVRMKKGNTIYQFLQRCLEMLRKDFSELKTVMADQLMYVKEDLILPHHYTFYDFIVTKARGKSGPLFTFDVHDDVRMTNDATLEKEDSHAGKVLLRHWYERNKHIFPASRWEPYDPTKTYTKYTVSDKNKKAGSSNRSLLVYDVDADALVLNISGAHFRAPHTLCALTGSSKIAQPARILDLILSSAICDGVKLWDLRTARCVQKYSRHYNRAHLSGIDVSPCCRYVAVASEDKCVYLYDSRQCNDYLCKLSGFTAPVMDVAFSPCKPQLFAAALNGSVLSFFVDKEDRK